MEKTEIPNNHKSNLKSSYLISRKSEKIFFILVLCFFCYWMFFGNPFGNPHVEWEHTYFNQHKTRTNCITATQDGGYLLIGTLDSSDPPQDRIHLIKTDPQGNLIWEKTIGEKSVKGYSGQTTSDGGYIITGSVRSVSSRDVYLVKTDSKGNIEWEQTFGESNRCEGFSVQIVPTGGFIIAGFMGDDVYLIKTDVNGVLEWEKRIGGVYDEKGSSVQVTFDGGFIITGDVDPYNSNQNDVYLVKTDSFGNVEWERSYGGDFADYGNCVWVTSDGGYIVVGNLEVVEGSQDCVYVVKTDSGGEVLWERVMDKRGSSFGYCVRETSDHGFIVCGEVSSEMSGSSSDVFLVTLDNSGEVVWEEILGASGDDSGLCLEESLDGSFVVAGRRGNNCFLLKIKSER